MKYLIALWLGVVIGVHSSLTSLAPSRLWIFSQTSCGSSSSLVEDLMGSGVAFNASRCIDFDTFPRSQVGGLVEDSADANQLMSTLFQGRMTDLESSSELSIAIWFTTTTPVTRGDSYIVDIGPFQTSTSTGVGSSVTTSRFQILLRNTARIDVRRIDGLTRSCSLFRGQTGIVYDILAGTGDTFLLTVTNGPSGLYCVVAKQPRGATQTPTALPSSLYPTKMPTLAPTFHPSSSPTEEFASSPSSSPSFPPTKKPTSRVPTRGPSTQSPTLYPTRLPTTAPVAFDQVNGICNLTALTVPIPFTIPSTDSVIRLGTARSTQNPFPAKYHVLAMFDRELDLTEIETIYDLGVPNSVPAVNLDPVVFVVEEDQPDSFQWEQLFGFPVVVDADGDDITGVEITELPDPNRGWLTWENGTHLQVGDIVTRETRVLFSTPPHVFSSIECSIPLQPSEILTSFQFIVSDGLVYSVKNGSVDICVSAIHDNPEALPQNVTAKVGEYKVLTLGFFDPDNGTDSSMYGENVGVWFSNPTSGLFLFLNGECTEDPVVLEKWYACFSFCYFEDVVNGSFEYEIGHREYYFRFRDQSGLVGTPARLSVTLVSNMGGCGTCFGTGFENNLFFYTLAASGPEVVFIRDVETEMGVISLDGLDITYQPPENFNGQTWIRYRVCGQTRMTCSAVNILTVTIIPQQSIPRLTTDMAYINASEDRGFFQLRPFIEDFDNDSYPVTLTIEGRFVSVKGNVKGLYEISECETEISIGACSTIQITSLPSVLNSLEYYFVKRESVPNNTRVVSISLGSGDKISVPVYTFDRSLSGESAFLNSILVFVLVGVFFVSILCSGMCLGCLCTKRVVSFF